MDPLGCFILHKFQKVNAIFELIIVTLQPLQLQLTIQLVQLRLRWATLLGLSMQQQRRRRATKTN